VHPESYPVVRRILEATHSDVASLIGNTRVLRGLRPERFAGDGFGLPTVTDILAELEKPGRDPRPAFRTATFTEGVDTLEDLQPGMVLEGVVTNVAAFGAFVDVGVHSDGLVHVSAMSSSFVKDPRDVVKPGDVVRVKVLGVDVARQRISLSLRLDDEPGAERRQPSRPAPRERRRPPRAGEGPRRERPAEAPDTALAEALRRGEIFAAGAGLAPQALAPEALAAALPAGTVCAGDGAIRYRDRLGGLRVPRDDSPLHVPWARHHAALAESAGPPEPIYIRAPDADRALAARAAS
jgi:predicted RNA-binding protein with RPS1 domain